MAGRFARADSEDMGKEKRVDAPQGALISLYALNRLLPPPRPDAAPPRSYNRSVVIKKLCCGEFEDALGTSSLHVHALLW